MYDIGFFVNIQYADVFPTHPGIRTQQHRKTAVQGSALKLTLTCQVRQEVEFSLEFIRRD